MRSKDTFNNLSIQISWILKQLSLLAGLVLTACAPTIAAPTPTIQPYADELIFYNFFDYMPASVLEKFEAEYGITVRYTEYITYDEAVANLKAGNVYDVVLMEHDKIPELIEAGLLAPLDYKNIPNFKNISENFRDLSYCRLTQPCSESTTRAGSSS
jgi:spermidine/putrescine transport system substrate-binding protein